MFKLKKRERRELAKRLAIKNKFPKADRYDMMYREVDNQVEILGFLNDPRADLYDFQGREMFTPRMWITIGVLPANTVVQR